MTGPKLTPARRRALAVLAAGDRRNAEVRRSNATRAPDAVRLTVYWQTADWLVTEHLAVDGLGGARDGLRLTQDGADLARQLEDRGRS